MTMVVFYLTAAAVSVVLAVAAYILGRRSMRSEVEAERRHHSEQMAMAKESFEQQLAALRQMNKEQVEAQMKMIREQMLATSEEVLRARQTELGEANMEQVSKIIDPLQKSLKDMRDALDDSKEKHQEALHKLDATIQANMKSSADLNETAERLSRALTGEVKVQGNFGELKLKQLLEDLGLKDGEQYSSQEHLRDRYGYKIKDDEGRELIPDFILHFPDHRDVIVDSKMSFTAFERYINTEDPQEKTRYLKEHIASVRAQVDRLARKDYSRFLSDGYSKLNFVIMYIHTEGALNLALLNDTSLWREAYDKGVLILGPQTMYMNLRILELMWTQMRQLENQEEMMRLANLIVERTQDFAVRFKAVEKSMHEVMEGMEKLKITTSDSGPGIITAAKNLIKAGARENKKKKTLLITVIALLLVPLSAFAQKKGTPGPESIYRPVFGYVIDTVSNVPVQNVAVYGFDSLDDAMLGKKALDERRNPMKIRLKGDVVETLTDETGRYMIPALSKGVLVFYYKDKRLAVVEEINGRNSVSLGKKEKEYVYDYDLDFDLEGYAEMAYRRAKGKERAGVVLDLDFKCYIPMQGKDASDSRLIVERRVVDLETEELLSSLVPVVRDGKSYHKDAKKLISKGERKDSLYDLAGKFPVLRDTTSAVRVTDHLDTAPWKDRCFRLGYYVSVERAGEVLPLDTLYMMTNRINKPLKYLEYSFDPYGWEPQEEQTRSRRAVSRRLVLEGEYDGQVPEVLKDSSYLLQELHLKAVVAQDRPYEQCIVQADSMVNVAMAELRGIFAGKIDAQVRITKTSQVSTDPLYADNIFYRYVFTTGRRFSKNEYLRQIRRAKDESRIEELCRQAIEERQILDGVSWDYAANVLASIYLRQGKTDVTLLALFVDTSLEECDVRTEMDETVMNRREIVANQVMMLMNAMKFDEAASLAEMLPSEYACLRQIALCKAGNDPSDKASGRLVRESSVRNRILMDMFDGEVSASTLDLFDELPQDDAMTLFLRARALCMLHDNEAWAMQGALIPSSGGTVYAHVMDCLRKCFEADPSMVTVAKFDSEINEYALKEVLGVYVL